MNLFKNIISDAQVTLDKAQYDIYDENLSQAVYAISNNDTSCKHIACHLQNKKNITIDGNGALLLFHDRITPFLLDECENICLRNFTIDYDRTFYTQATILSANASCVELKIHKDYPFYVQGGDLIVKSNCWENDLHDGIMLFQEFNPATKSLQYNAPVLIYRVGETAVVDVTSPLPMRILTAQQTSENTIKLYGEFPWQYTVGNELVMTHEMRKNSGIVLHKCKNIRLENIHIVHTGAMGIVAQLSSDITLERIKVALGNHPNRLVSTNCDATHFIGCSGTITVKNCVLENMMDDGVNVHGVYTKIEKIVDAQTIIVRILHFQQFGVPFYASGDIVTITKGSTAQQKMQATVKDAYFISDELIGLKLEQEIVDVKEGDFLENQTTTPQLYIGELHTGNNRPRGILPTTPRKILIENSVFYNSGYGIHIAGDTCFWYESGAVRDVTIKDCYFLNNGHSMGDYSIAITPEFATTKEQAWFHSNIKIENNCFESFTDGAVFANGVNNLTVKNNKYIATQTYAKRVNTKKIVTENCFNIIIKE